MRVKVIKEIKGLVPGDILYYNDKTGMYEITKTDYDFGDKSESVKSVRVSIESYIVEEHENYFVYLDDEDNDIEINKICWDDFPENSNELETSKEVEPETKNETVKTDEVSNLQEQLKELQKKLEDIENPSVKYYTPSYYTVNPFRHFWYI
jgi:hypothetical protein